MPLKRVASQMFCNEEESESVRPAKRAAQGKGSMRGEVIASPSASASASAKDRGKGKGKAVAPVAGRICLRCSKRIHLEGDSTTRGVTVPVGFRCDLTAFRKCSYCAHTHHDCEEVGWFSVFFWAY